MITFESGSDAVSEPVEILGLDKIKKISDNTDLETDITGLDMIRSDDEGVNITGLDSIRSIFTNDFPKMSSFAMELMSLAAKAKELDSELRQYGSESHRYEFAPVAALSDVRDFEVRHSIKLPVSYVEFLTQVGNGGAGPDFGMLSLEQLELRNFFAHTNRSVSYSMARCESDFYTFPFSCEKPVMVDSSLTEAKWDIACNALSEISPNERPADYEERRRELYNGVIQIGDTEGSFCPVLICTGDMAGEVMEFSHDLDMPKYIGKCFEDWIIGYFEDVIRRFARK